MRDDGGGGLKIVKNCVTSFMDDPLSKSLIHVIVTMTPTTTEAPTAAVETSATPMFVNNLSKSFMPNSS